MIYEEGRISEGTEIGKIHIAPQAIELIAKVSTMEVKGVAELSGGFTGEIKEFLGRNKNAVKGIKVEVGEEETAVDVSVIIKYGYMITEVAENIQENVKSSIEAMTNLRVVEVNVHINGIQFDDYEDKL